MDEDGKLQRISVTPAPFTSPHPPVFIAAAGSQETIEYASSRGLSLVLTPARAAKYAEKYVEEAAKAGKTFAFGENQNMVRWLQIGETNEQAHQMLRDYDLEIYRNLYYPLSPYGRMDEANPTQSLVDSGLYLAGNIDEVRDQFIAQWRQLPAEYVTIVSHYGSSPLRAPSATSNCSPSTSSRRSTS